MQLTLVLVPPLEDPGLLKLAADGLPSSMQGAFSVPVLSLLIAKRCFSRTAFGVTIAGEWSVALNDCGLFMKGVNLPPSFAGGCAQWEDSSAWTDGTKAGLMRVAMASMDALRDWFFWTWKVIELTTPNWEFSKWFFLNVYRLLLPSRELSDHLTGRTS
jgi:hypothetical protein